MFAKGCRMGFGGSFLYQTSRRNFGKGQRRLLIGCLKARVHDLGFSLMLRRLKPESLSSDSFFERVS